MKIWDVIYYVVLEMPQILVILNVIFGYEIVKSKKRWIWISVCTTLIMILNQAIDNYALAVNTSMIISLFFVAFCMQGQKNSK